MRAGRSEMKWKVFFIMYAAVAMRFAAASIAEGAEDQVWRDKAGTIVPGAYIVTFNDQVASSREGLARLQEHLAGPASRPQGVAPGAAPLLSAEVLGAAGVSAASVDVASADDTGLKAAVLRFAPTVRAASVADASDSDVAPENSPEASAIRGSGIVARVEPDRYATIQQDQCVPGSALAGASPSEAPAVDWVGCATPETMLVWFGERCGPRFDQARYMGVYAMDKATGKPVPGCVLTRNHTADFNTRWFGDCGSAPAVAASLPTRRFCSPNAAPGKTTCVRPADLETGLSVELPQPATCNGVTGRAATYRGIRCGPRGKFVQWSRVMLGDAPAPAPVAPAAAASPEEEAGGSSPVSGPVCSRMAKFARVKRGSVLPIMANAEMVGACGVPPIANKDMPIEVCEYGQAGVPKPLDLPRPVNKIPEVPANPDEELPWGIPRIEAIVGGQVTAALPVSVAVIDTGIDETHPDLKVAGGASWVGSSFADGNGHGTHVAGTIGALNNGAGVIGVAPGTPIWALRVLDARGSGAFSAIVNALLWVAKNGRSKNIRVVNMSLGGDGGADPVNSAICDAIRDVTAAGIAVVAAAGNAGASGPRSWTNNLPAVCPGVLVVTAVDPSNGPAKFSYFLGAAESANAAHKGRTVAAPGVDIKSTWARDLGRGDYRSISGTSMASPHVAAVTAKCFAAGVCTGGAQAIDAVTAAAVARNMGDEAYGFRGDPFFGRSSVGVDRYYGPLVHAGWRF